MHYKLSHFWGPLNALDCAQIARFPSKGRLRVAILENLEIRGLRPDHLKMRTSQIAAIQWTIFAGHEISHTE